MNTTIADIRKDYENFQTRHQSPMPYAEWLEIRLHNALQDLDDAHKVTTVTL